MVYFEVFNFSELNLEYSIQQIFNKVVQNDSNFLVFQFIIGFFVVFLVFESQNGNGLSVLIGFGGGLYFFYIFFYLFSI